jgi:mono/diheme cytochrome c family protein
VQSIPEPPTTIAVSEDSIAQGANLYVRHCSRCHNQPGTEHSGNFPNLGAMSISTHNIFQQILLEGVFEYGGMPSYADVLDESGAQYLQQYLVDQQRQAYSVEPH